MYEKFRRGPRPTPTRSLLVSLTLAAALAAMPALAAEAPALAIAGERGSLFAGEEVLSRRDLLRAVLERNQTVEAARAAWRAAAARATQAGALDDPMLGYSIAPASIGSDVVRFGQVIDFSQRLPFPGKLGLRAEVEAAEARADRGGYEAVRRDTAMMASILFDRVWTVERSLEVNAEHHRLLDDLMRSARAQYEAGRIEQYELIRVEVELAHVEHEKVLLDTERNIVVTQLNALLHRAPAAFVPATAAALDPVDALHAEVRDDVATALASRPELASAAARVAAAEAGASLARREYLPDFSVGASYNSMWDMPEHQYMAGFSINIPLQLGRRRAAVDEAEAELLRRRSERAATADRIAAEVDVARRRLVEAQHVAMLYRDRIVPASRDRVDAVRAALESGGAEFDRVVDAERALRDAELAYQVAVAERSTRHAELARALGEIPVGADGIDSVRRGGDRSSAIAALASTVTRGARTR